jgi:hypothetical protein
MTPTGPRDAPRELKPGDLYVVTGDAHWHPTCAVGDIINLREREIERCKLLERHPCGALEFLVLPPEVK